MPFHMWTPDVYQGAPTPVTGFMAAAVKVAGVRRAAAGDVRGARRRRSGTGQPVFWVVAVAHDARRRPAGRRPAPTSSGCWPTPPSPTPASCCWGWSRYSPQGLSATLFYLLAYGFATVGAFAIVMLVREPGRRGGAPVRAGPGLGRRSPMLAGVFALFLLALAGIPLTSGFTAKFGVFAAAVGAGEMGVWPVVVAALASAISAFFYLRVIVLMFFTTPSEDVLDRGHPQPH